MLALRDFSCFFFQAEDGIRALYVTGVQTCALPISPISGCSIAPLPAGWNVSPGAANRTRSEERRVGEECRSRWSPYHYKKNADRDVRAVGEWRRPGGVFYTLSSRGDR